MSYKWDNFKKVEILVWTIEQLGIYATFLRNQSISKHFISLIPISKEVGAHL